ncbi:NAD(P)H-binding protein [Nesterenkonia sp. MY13]|uniref:NAD(P)H-binding protein n=1 Tax=Nesterenkonia sedimenti TaxID=1463632 RepID=A0A7X8TKF4_9MICC|nr:NAD(P)H-binding protein [Nesterenkonia sedimenti]NLS10185.1 NAD(P)H-binding protein [Nesterenkonia sedimenti]
MKITVVGGTGTVGSLAVAAARARGHEVTSASRRTGVNVATGEGLNEALSGTDAVVDVSSMPTLSASPAVKFFSAAANNVLTAAETEKVPHVVRLSIIGVDRNPHGFYAGQLAMEKIYDDAAVPTTVLRAAQFHEFAAQTLQRSTVGPVVLAPRARVQPVAGREVAEKLVSLAEGQPLGRAGDLAGPREEDLAEMVRAYARSQGSRRLILPVRLPMPMMRGMAAGLQLPNGSSPVVWCMRGDPSSV